MSDRESSPERLEEDRPKRLHPESDSDGEEIQRPSKKGANKPSISTVQPEDEKGWRTAGEKEKERRMRQREKKAEASTPSPDQPLNAETPSFQPRDNPPRRTPLLTVAPRTKPQGPAFRILPTTDWTAYEVVQALEKDTTLSLTARPGRDEAFILYPKDDATMTALRNLTSLQGKEIKLQQLHEPGKKPTKGVVMGFPHGLPLTLLTKEENILSAIRCKYGKQRSDTRQVMIEHMGPLPGKIDLGIWGIFYIRPYSQEPLRCYRCHAFGHGISRCRNPVKCGICSGSHETTQCLVKYKAKEDVTPKCPNCEGEHHAWNRACPVRLAKVEKSMEGQARWVQAHCEAPPGTFVWGSQRSNSSTSPAPPSQEDFPALHPAHRAQARTTPSHTTQHPAPAPPTPQSQEPAVTLTATGLKSLLTGLIVSLSKIVKGDTDAQSLDAVVDSLVAQALQPPRQTPQAPVSTSLQPATHQPSQVPPTGANDQQTPDPVMPPQTPATVQAPVTPEPTSSTTTSEQHRETPPSPNTATGTSPTSPSVKSKRDKSERPRKICKKERRLKRHLRREHCASCSYCSGT